MGYIFRGNLCGWLCAHCEEPLSDVVVRLYRHSNQQNITALAVADASDTFAVLTDEQVKAKSSLLIAEAKTDADGNFLTQYKPFLSYGPYYGPALINPLRNSSAICFVYANPPSGFRPSSEYGFIYIEASKRFYANSDSRSNTPRTGR